jgi:hypothetical protein
MRVELRFQEIQLVPGIFFFNTVDIFPEPHFFYDEMDGDYTDYPYKNIDQGIEKYRGEDRLGPPRQENMLVHPHGQQRPQKGPGNDSTQQRRAKEKILFPVQEPGDREVDMEIIIRGDEQQVAELHRQGPAEGKSMVLKYRYPENVQSGPDRDMYPQTMPHQLVHLIIAVPVKVDHYPLGNPIFTRTPANP